MQRGKTLIKDEVPWQQHGRDAFQDDEVKDWKDPEVGACDQNDKGQKSRRADGYETAHETEEEDPWTDPDPWKKQWKSRNVS